MSLIGQQLDETLPYASWRSRAASTAVIAFYLTVAATVTGRAAVLLTLSFRFATRRLASPTPGLSAILGFCLLPVSCIWFPEAPGSLLGGGFKSGSSRAIVWILGWVVAR